MKHREGRMDGKILKEIFLKVKLRKKVIGDKTKIYLDYKELSNQYWKKYRKMFDKNKYFNSRAWTPKEGKQLLGFATKRHIPIKETDLFKKELNKKERRVWDIKDEMDLNKTRYEAPNLNYIKKGE